MILVRFNLVVLSARKLVRSDLRLIGISSVVSILQDFKIVYALGALLISLLFSQSMRSDLALL